MMLAFVWPTADKSLTLMALALCALLILSPTDHRLAVLTLSRRWARIFSGSAGHDARVLDVLYSTDPAAVCSAGHGMAALSVLASGLARQAISGQAAHSRPAIAGEVKQL